MSIAEITAPRASDTVSGIERAGVVARGASKRAVDLLVGVPLCVVAVPVIAVCALVLALQLRSWPGFVHRRVGQHGSTIPIPKLRTLPPDFPQYADKTAAHIRPVSRFAALLRRTHLDELPQLFLVPLGHLSLVGPRPLMVTEAAACPDPAYLAARTSIPQGCTGLWQVGDRADERASDAPEFDYFYLEHRSLRLDLWILWRTLARGLGGRPFAVADVPPWVRRDAGRLA